MKYESTTGGEGGWRLRNGLHLRRRDLRVGLWLVAIIAALALLSLAVGAATLSPGDLFRDGLSSEQAYALWQVRLPHIVLGFMVGWCVALAGAVMQSITHNPLADPGLFGVSQGAMTSIVLLQVFFPAAPKAAVALAGLAGGLTIAVLLTALVGRRYAGGLAMLLMGLALSSVMSAVSTFLLLYLPTEMSLSLSAWMEGSLFQASWALIASFLPVLLLSLIAIALSGPSLRRYQVGGELALALGEPVGYSRPLLMALSVLLSAAAVTAVGPLAFLGILAPHLASFLSAPAGRARLWLSGLVGGGLVIAADSVTRAAPAGLFLPVGLSFTLMGVPLFVLTLWLRGRGRG